MRVLVCGGRDFVGRKAEECVSIALDNAQRMASPGDMIVIQGGATGADALARKWCGQRGVPCWTYGADWNVHGKAAGPIRNAKMLRESKPDVVIAFPGGKGTANMVSLAEAARVPVARPPLPLAGCTNDLLGAGRR